MDNFASYNVLNKENELWRSWKRGYIPDWNNPKDLNEKICWEIINNKMDRWTELADKVLVRNFVKERGYGENLSELYGVWDKADDIDFDSLPDKFVLKCNHDSGSSKIIDKSVGFNKREVIYFLNSHLRKTFGVDSCEPHYFGINKKVMAEEFLTDINDFSKTPVDYKFWCFDGEVASCMVCYDRISGGHATFDLYDVNTWEPIRNYLTARRRTVYKDVPKPETLDLMIKMASDLSKGFPQVRVDLYNTERGVVFGEMTFTSMCGRIYYFTDEYLKILGDKMRIEE